MRSLSLVDQAQLIWHFFFQLPWKWWLLFFLVLGFFLIFFADRFFGNSYKKIVIGLTVVCFFLLLFRYHTSFLPLLDFIGTQFVSFLYFPNLFLYLLVCLFFTFLFFKHVVFQPKLLRYRLWITFIYCVFFLCNCCLFFLIVRGEVIYHSPEFYTDATLLSLLQTSLFLFSLWVVGYFVLFIYGWFRSFPVSVKHTRASEERVFDEPMVSIPLTISTEKSTAIEPLVTGNLYTDLEPVLKDAHDFFGL